MTMFSWLSDLNPGENYVQILDTEGNLITEFLEANEFREINWKKDMGRRYWNMA